MSNKEANTKEELELIVTRLQELIVYKRVLNKVYQLGDADTKALIDEVWVSRGLN
tara:strand:+ start:340 stop:504 length:165 start_codon:yes stop_codon:yes gene_type:complete